MATRCLSFDIERVGAGVGGATPRTGLLHLPHGVVTNRLSELSQLSLARGQPGYGHRAEPDPGISQTPVPRRQPDRRPGHPPNGKARRPQQA